MSVLTLLKETITQLFNSSELTVMLSILQCRKTSPEIPTETFYIELLFL